MIASLPLAPGAPDLPPFIQEVYGASPAMLDRFNFWSPNRLGDDGHDYAAGVRHFQTALTFAHANKMADLLMHIVSHMCQVGVGAIERGFLDSMAAKAACGAVPAPLPDHFIQIYQDLLSAPAEAVRAGEGEAGAFLQLARDTQSPAIVGRLVVDIVNRDNSRFGFGTIAFLHTICRAAYCGAAN